MCTGTKDASSRQGGLLRRGRECETSWSSYKPSSLTDLWELWLKRTSPHPHTPTPQHLAHPVPSLHKRLTVLVLQLVLPVVINKAPEHLFTLSTNICRCWPLLLFFLQLFPLLWFSLLYYNSWYDQHILIVWFKYFSIFLFFSFNSFFVFFLAHEIRHTLLVYPHFNPCNVRFQFLILLSMDIRCRREWSVHII